MLMNFGVFLQQQHKCDYLHCIGSPAEKRGKRSEKDVNGFLEEKLWDSMIECYVDAKNKS